MEFSLFEKFAELNALQWALFALLFAGAIACAYLLRARKDGDAPDRRADTRALVMGALCVALAFVLSYIRFFRMPQGGSITLGSTLPIALYAHWYGPRKGFTAAFAYSVLQFIQDPVVLSVWQVLIDYTLSFTVLGLAAFFPKRLTLGVIVGGVARILANTVSGAVFFAEYAPAGMNPWIYSAGYNFGALGPDLAICVALAIALQQMGVLERLRPTNARPIPTRA